MLLWRLYILNRADQAQQDCLQYHSIEQAKRNHAYPRLEEDHECIKSSKRQNRDWQQCWEAAMEHAGPHLTDGDWSFIIPLILVSLEIFGWNGSQISVRYMHRIVNGDAQRETQVNR